MPAYEIKITRTMVEEQLIVVEDTSLDLLRRLLDKQNNIEQDISELVGGLVVHGINVTAREPIQTRERIHAEVTKECRKAGVGYYAWEKKKYGKISKHRK